MTDDLRAKVHEVIVALDAWSRADGIIGARAYADSLRAALAAEARPEAEGPSRAFSAMRTDVVALRDRALTREGEHAAIHGAASLNGWTHKVAAFDEVLSLIDEIEEMS